MMKTFLLILCAFLCYAQSFSQCNSCTYTAVQNGSYTLQANQTLCFTTNGITNVTINYGGSPNFICIAPNISVSLSTLNLNGTTVNLNSGARLTLTSNLNFYGTSNIFNVNSGSTLAITGNVNFSDNYTINNNGTVTFSTVSSQMSGTSAFLYNNADAVFEHTGNGKFLFTKGPRIVNKGSMVFGGVMENQLLQEFTNEQYGNIVVRKKFFNKGTFTNNGQLLLPCNGTNTGPCGLDIERFGETVLPFTNNTCISVDGDMSIQSSATNNSVITIQKPTSTATSSLGVFQVAYAVTGTGRFIVDNGHSSMTSAGSFPLNAQSKTAIGFWDKNTSGGNFDQNQSVNSPPSTITINTTPNPCTTLLPVTGLELQAKQAGNDVQLIWSTLTEYNTSNFLLERGNDGIKFSAIATQASAGSSNSRKNYTYTDAGVQQPVVYYRIKMIGKDGSSTYSSIVAVRLSKLTTGVQLFPNPSKGPVFASFAKAGTYHITLTDVAGKTISSKSVVVSSRQTISVERPSSTVSGAYLMQVYNTATADEEVIKVSFN